MAKTSEEDATILNLSSSGWPGLASLYLHMMVIFGSLKCAKVWSLWSTAGMDALWESEESIHRACVWYLAMQHTNLQKSAFLICQQVSGWSFWVTCLCSLLSSLHILVLQWNFTVPLSCHMLLISDPDFSRSRAWPEHMVALIPASHHNKNKDKRWVSSELPSVLFSRRLRQLQHGSLLEAQNCF